jgi:hypothetical protein
MNNFEREQVLPENSHIQSSSAIIPFDKHSKKALGRIFLMLKIGDVVFSHSSKVLFYTSK